MTSSELFCKKYDPFFATVNLFGNTDIALPFAIMAFVITLGGALFVRMFWCKYLCPLGAFSNIFLNAAASGGLVVAYAVAYLSGSPIDPLWLLVGLVLVGWVTEVGVMRSLLLPLPRITRNELTCSDCGHCDEQCHQGINISETASVRHIDCNLCTDCVRACPLKNVLTVNNKPRNTYLAPAATVVLIVAALFTTNWVEFTTISLRWGKPTGTESRFTQTGMKSIKCYGSSMALAGTLENIEGILGVETYVKSKSVTVFYDATMISEGEVKASLFASSKTEIRALNLDPNEPVGVFDIGILRLFDAVDFNDLTTLLGERDGILGVETRFGEPVRTTIYYLPARISPVDIRNQLNRKSFLRDGKQVELNFETADQGVARNAIRYGEFKNLMFRGYDSEFNGYEQYESNRLSVYTFSMPDAAKPELRTSLDLLASHLSNDEGIVRFTTGFDGTPVGNVYYDRAQTSEAAIRAALENRVLTYFITDSTTEQIPNPFQIKGSGAGGK
jgi:hypothetical protein